MEPVMDECYDPKHKGLEDRVKELENRRDLLYNDRKAFLDDADRLRGLLLLAKEGLAFAPAAFRELREKIDAELA